MYCPTIDDVHAAALSLLPRGRAFSNHDGAPAPETTIYKFWRAFADPLQWLIQRLCDLRLEMFCQTIVETRDQWMIEYGLPDDCDAFPDLCTKVAAIGGARCEYFQAVAARAGWSIECTDLAETCGDRMGCSVMGCSQMGATQGAVFRITVHLGRSPAYGGGPQQTPPNMGLLQFGMPIACPPNISPIECLIDRIAPAHVEVVYVTF